MLGFRCYVLGIASGQEPEGGAAARALAPSHASSAHLFTPLAAEVTPDAAEHTHGRLHPRMPKPPGHEKRGATVRRTPRRWSAQNRLKASVRWGLGRRS